MTTRELTVLLAVRVMRWTVHPGRYLMENRRWTPDWRFQPMKTIADAIRLLDAADPEEYTINSGRGRGCTVHVQIGGAAGEATDASKARAITYAVARAIGLEPVGGKAPKTGVESR